MKALERRSKGLPNGEAAEILGTSVSTLRRLEQSVLPPFVDENGVHLKSEQRILEYKIQRTSARGGSHSIDGVLASAAFEQFDDGAGPIEVVKQFKVEPRLARDLHREWADMSGGFVVSGASAAKLRRLAWMSDDNEIRSGDDLVALFATGEDRLLLLRAANRAPLLPVLRSSNAASAEARGGRTGSNRSEA